MSTRCRIGIKNENGTITSIYCHHDGYIEGVGEMLIDNYKDEAKIRELMKLGDISSLGAMPIDNPRAWEPLGVMYGDKDWEKRMKEVHPEDMCDTYKSRGEDCPARESKNELTYLLLMRDCWGDYAYLFENGKWTVNEDDGKGFKDLADEL